MPMSNPASPQVTRSQLPKGLYPLARLQRLPSLPHVPSCFLQSPPIVQISTRQSRIPPSRFLHLKAPKLALQRLIPPAFATPSFPHPPLTVFSNLKQVGPLLRPLCNSTPPTIFPNIKTSPRDSKTTSLSDRSKNNRYLPPFQSH